MSGIWNALVVLVALTVIGCGVTAESGIGTPAPTDIPVFVDRANVLVKEGPLQVENLSLIRRVEELEAELKDLR